MSGSGCDKRGLIDAHFAGSIGTKEERSLREHLPGCQECQAYYQRHLVLSRLDPKALDAPERLARGLGIRTGRRFNPLGIWVPAGATALALMLFVLIMAPWKKTDTDDGFSTRGHPQSSVVVYRIPLGGNPAKVEDEIEPGEELAFAYLNPAGKKWLMIFGVDEEKRIYWYHPAWRDPQKNPRSVAIQTASGLIELPAAVSHELQGEALRIYAIFTDDPWTVREMEELVRRHSDLPERLELKDALQESVRLRIRQ